jgi:hypothetical protein
MDCRWLGGSGHTVGRIGQVRPLIPRWDDAQMMAPTVPTGRQWFRESGFVTVRLSAATVRNRRDHNRLVAISIIAFVISAIAVVTSIALWKATKDDAEASRQAVRLTRLQMRQAQMPVVMPVADRGTDEEGIRPRIGPHMRSCRTSQVPDPAFGDPSLRCVVDRAPASGRVSSDWLPRPHDRSSTLSVLAARSSWRQADRPDAARRGRIASAPWAPGARRTVRFLIGDVMRSLPSGAAGWGCSCGAQARPRAPRCAPRR